MKPRTRALIDARLAYYREMHPRILSSLVIVAAAMTTAIVAIGYTSAMEWATLSMSDLSVSRPWLFALTSPA